MVDYTVLLATNGNTFRTFWADTPVKHLDRATLYKADGSIVEYTGRMGTLRTRMILTTPSNRLVRATGEAPSMPPLANLPSTRSPAGAAGCT